MIFCEMVKGYEQEFTGYGISSYFPNQNEKVLYVNCESKSVSNRRKFWTFDVFLDLNDLELNNLWDNEYRNYLGDI